MKHFKKFFSYLVALTMVLSLAAFTGTKVYAETTTYKLTFERYISTGHTYEVYKVFKGTLSVKDNNKKVLSDIEWAEGVKEKKTVNNAEKTIYDALAEENSAFSGVTSAKAVAEKLSGGEKDNQLVKDFAQVVGQFLGTDKTVVKASETETSTEITGLTAGYYFVKDQDNTQNDKNDAYTRFIVQVVGDETATIKSNVPTVEKKVKDINDSEDSNIDDNAWQDSADYDIGDDVPYQITGTMPANISDYKSYNYVFTDTMSPGLTYTKNTAKIEIGDTNVKSSFKEEVTTKEDGSTVVTWTCDDLKGIKGVTIDKNTKVVVTYSAQLNTNAKIGSKGNPNTVNLTYSNNPNKGGEGDTGKTPDDKNIVFTYKLNVNKV